MELKETGIRLSDKAIKEYQAIYREEFGEELSVEQAQEQGLRLLRLFRILVQPLPDRLEAEVLSTKNGAFDKSP